MFLGSMTLGEPCSAVPRTVGAVGVRRMVLTWGGARRACRREGNEEFEQPLKAVERFVKETHLRLR